MFVFLLGGLASYPHALDLLFTWLLYLQGMQIIFYMFFQMFTFKYPNLAKALRSWTETLKIVWSSGVHGFFFNSRDPWHLVAHTNKGSLVDKKVYQHIKMYLADSFGTHTITWIRWLTWQPNQPRGQIGKK